MTEAGWLSFLPIGEYALYIWGSYLVALALMLVEFVLLVLRGKAILGHLGWVRGFRQPLPAPRGRPRDR